ncbi:MAG: hypothetical protein IPI19_11915 [Ignavibacteriales bacterium]|nr:hypothetical protein [Ignavibacteriales bacterium]
MFDATNGYAVGSSGKVWKTTDGGHSFEVYAGATTIQAFNDVNFYNTQYAWLRVMVDKSGKLLILEIVGLQSVILETPRDKIVLQ